MKATRSSTAPIRACVTRRCSARPRTARSSTILEDGLTIAAGCEQPDVNFGQSTARCPRGCGLELGDGDDWNSFSSDYPKRAARRGLRRRGQGPAADLQRRARDARRRRRQRHPQGLAVQRHAARRRRRRRDQGLGRRRPHRGRRRQRLDQPRHLLRTRQRLRGRRPRHRHGRRLVDPERRLPPADRGEHGRRRQRRPPGRGRQRRQRREDRVARLRHARRRRGRRRAHASGRTSTRATRRCSATAATTS